MICLNAGGNNNFILKSSLSAFFFSILWLEFRVTFIFHVNIRPNVKDLENSMNVEAYLHSQSQIREMCVYVCYVPQFTSLFFFFYISYFLDVSQEEVYS